MIEGVMTAKPQVFAAAVGWAAKFLATRPTVPIQAGMMMEAGSGHLRLSVYNEHVSATAVIEVGGDATGSVVVSGRLLDALVKTLADKEVRIGEDDGALGIVAGRWAGSLPPMAVEDFPALVTAAPTIGTASGNGLADAVARAAAAAEDDLTKVVLSCVCLTIGKGQISAVGTDTIRMARTVTPYDGQDVEGVVTVPAHLMSDVAAAFIGPDDVRVGLDSGTISLTSATRSVAMKRIVEPYPFVAPIEKAMANVKYEHSALVRVADLAGAMKRAGLMADKLPIVLSFGEGSIVVAADGGESRKKSAESVDAEYDGPEYEAVFNARYLGDILGSTPGDHVRIAVQPVARGARPMPIAASVDGNQAWQHLLMPIKKQ